ncbi:MAG: 3-hydroxyphenylpropionic acid transporter [Caulobacteraceae bacterium]|nr:3-hydroxyphenylpropionic acid transporter [Caulobacteraceae bacterium]
MTQAVAIGERGRAGLTLALCFVAILCEGIDIQSMGLAAPRMAPALGLARDQLGPLFSASILGLLIGAVIFGRVADRFGRKGTLIVCLVVFGVFSLATAAVRPFGALLVVRLLAGLGLGGALPNLVALAAEAVAPESRAGLVTRITCGLPFGGALSGLVAANLDWRDIFYLGGLAPLALAPIVALALPESRAFLEARHTAPATAPARGDFRWILFGEGRAGATLLLWTASFGSLLSLYVLLNWLPTFLGDKGLAKSDASLVSLLFNLGAGVGCLILAELLDRRRPRRTIGLWYVGLIASLVGLALVNTGFLAAAAAGFAVGFFVSSAPLPLYGMAPCYYAVSMRGTGVGASVAVGRAGAILGPLLAAALLGLGAGASGVLLALLPITAVAGGATMALIGRPRLAD